MNKLLAALRNRDADEISEQHPPVRAVMLADDVECVFMGREGDLLIAFVVDGRKSIRQSKHDGGGAVWEFQDKVTHIVGFCCFSFDSPRLL